MSELNEPRKSIIDELLDTISSLDQEKTDRKMEIAVKIAKAIRAKGWKNKEFLQAVGKSNPSVITKWLSGTTNFTIETLVNIEIALGIRLLDVGPPKETVKQEFFICLRDDMEVINDRRTDIIEMQRNALEAFAFSTRVRSGKYGNETVEV